MGATKWGTSVVSATARDHFVGESCTLAWKDTATATHVSRAPGLSARTVKTTSFGSTTVADGYVSSTLGRCSLTASDGYTASTSAASKMLSTNLSSKGPSRASASRASASKTIASMASASKSISSASSASAAVSTASVTQVTSLSGSMSMSSPSKNLAPTSTGFCTPSKKVASASGSFPAPKAVTSASGGYSRASKLPASASASATIPIQVVAATSGSLPTNKAGPARSRAVGAGMSTLLEKFTQLQNASDAQVALAAAMSSSSVTKTSASSSTAGKPSGSKSVGHGLGKWLQGSPAQSCLRDLEERIDVAAMSVIAAGSFGEVCLATDTATAQKLAVKVITEQDARKEVKLLSELDHPHIVKLLDVMIHTKQLPQTERAPPYLCIVMDYVPNSYSIAKLISAVGPVNSDLVNLILKQLASALEAMHKGGIVHRDIWSENMLLNQETGSMMLVDFGAAEHFDSGPDSFKALNLPYVSPEAAKRQRQGPGDDAWALGLVLSEMLTGKFIKDRLKCSNKPIANNAAQIGELLVDCASHDDTPDARLSRACKQLLDFNVSRRLTMTALIGILDVSSTGSVMKTGSNGDETLRFSNSASIPDEKSTLEAFSTTFPTSAPPVAAATSTSALSAPAVTSSPSQWQSTGASSLSRVLKTEGTSVSVAPAAESTVLAGASIGCSRATVAGRSSFSVGQRIKYVSRTNGAQYAGMIVSRSSLCIGAGTASSSTLLNILLDCGEKKEIADDNLWRLSHE